MIYQIAFRDVKLRYLSAAIGKRPAKRSGDNARIGELAGDCDYGFLWRGSSRKPNSLPPVGVRQAAPE
jgi:hypothetical protein